ncbi:MAG: lipopolysaccharide biosynthesis protein [Gammaproteobacteria bacterium]
MLWVVGGQAVTALGTLIGVRILTQFLPPAAYGVVSLALGISTLVVALVAAPLTQAAMHYYPAVAATGSVRTLLTSLLRCFLRMAPWIGIAAVLAAGAYLKWGDGSAIVALILLVLLASDSWRSANLSLLNAARVHWRYGMWQALDAWGRPLLGAAAVLTIGPSPEAVLGAYACVSAFLVFIFAGRVWRDESHAPSVDSSAHGSIALDARLWSYALPLVPLGIIGWASNLGDRYIIGGLLGVASAGMYAAVYGLAGAPFMLVNGTLEQGLRPLYQAAVSRGDHHRANTILKMWVSAAVGICTAGVILFVLCHEWIASLFVGKAYRDASVLMPWISVGYGIRAVSYVFERVCYAYGKTRRALLTQLYAVLAAAAITPAGVIALGLKGAAMAVPVYFSVQLAVAVFFARRTLGEVGQAHGNLDIVAATSSA